MIGIPTPTPKDILRAYDFGILEPKTACELLEAVIPDHDCKLEDGHGCECEHVREKIADLKEKSIKR